MNERRKLEPIREDKREKGRKVKEEEIKGG
jgi:hypothetical protein